MKEVAGALRFLGVKAICFPRRYRLFRVSVALLLGAASLSAFATSAIRFRFTTHTVDENVGEAVLEVWRSGDTATAVAADYATVEGTGARAGEDFAASAGTVSFTPGITNQILRIPILNNSLSEPGETFHVQLANPTADTVLGLPAIITIRDNDGIKLESVSYRGGEGAGAVTLALVRGPDELAQASVDYALVPFSATPGEDFALANGTVGFQAGERVKLLAIPLVNDGLSEPNETFRVEFSNAVGGTLLTQVSASVTILDNDPGIGFVQNRRWVHEDQEGVLLEVSRGNDGLLGPFTVDYTVADGTAVAGEDFIAAGGTLRFAAGEMTRPLWIPVINDGVAETDQIFQVTLGNPTGGLALGPTANRTATVTICDATGMEPRRLRGIQARGDGTIQLDLEGGVHKRFLRYYSVFQLEASSDLRQWAPLRLLGYRNNSTNPPVFSEALVPEATARYYRVNPTPFVTPSIPPTGPHSVGITRRFLFDPLRRNRFGISTNNSFLVTLWYPAQPLPGQTIAGFDPEQHANDIDWHSPAFMDRNPRFVSYGILDAPLRPTAGGYPVVINSHCSGCNGLDQESLAEDLASHGYVVATIDHADAPLSLLPDGTTLKQPLQTPVTLSRVQDLKLLVDELARFNQDDPLLRGAFRLPLLAAMGWSAGADTIVEYIRLDARCAAAIAFDGGASPSRLEAEKPSLTMNIVGNGNLGLFSLATRDAYWLTITGAIHQDFGTYWWDDTEFEQAREIQYTIHAYVLSFLNKHLLARDDHLLDARSPLHPRVGTFRKK